MDSLTEGNSSIEGESPQTKNPKEKKQEIAHEMFGRHSKLS